MKPRQYSARDINGKYVEGWYVELHSPIHGDESNPNKVTGYRPLPYIFNDEEGERGKGGYWHEIVPETLQPSDLGLWN